MSEFSIEEKAKRYDEAIEKAEKWRNAPNINKIPTFGNKIIEDIFPELQKPNDEKIKNALIALVKCNERCGYTLLNNVSTSSMLNWLEKQDKETISQPKNNDKNLKNVLIRFFEDRYPKAMEIYDGDFTVTVGQILAWLAKQNDQNSNILWHDISEEPEEHREIFCKWKGSDDNTWHDVAFYHPSNKTFWNGEQQIEDVVKWAYIDEMLNKSNPYSGVSFQYNSHIWGMCARDGGVEISIDNELKAFVSIDKSFIYPISQSYLAPKSASQAIKEIVIDNANKVEPKFKVGDWVVFNGLTLYINEVLKGYYRTISKGGIPNSYDWNIDNAARLWTIKEARDGDVLVCESEWTCIFKTLVNEEIFSSYCFMDSTGWFCELGSECHTLKEEFVKAYNGKIHPAKKEQRELLFTKMKEAGYEWNFDKKELIKL